MSHKFHKLSKGPAQSVSRRAAPKTFGTGLAGMALGLLLTTGVTRAALFQELPGLSAAAQNSLVAHFDARTGVGITAGEVTGWTPVDGDGDALPGRALTRSGLLTGVISYDGDDTVSWTAPSGGGTGLLVGTLNGVPAGTAYTVFWRGQHTVPSANSAGSHPFLLNSASLNVSSGRSGTAGGSRIELLDDNIFYLGASIAAYDNQTTVWSTVFSGATHRAYADGTDLAVAGTPSYRLLANPSLTIGGAAGGRHFNGELSDLIIFHSALGDADRMLVEGYLAAVPEPSVAWVAGLLAVFAGWRLAGHPRPRQ